MTTVAKGQPIELTSPALAADMEVDAPSSSNVDSEGDLYTRLKTLQRQLEFYEIQVRNSTGLICITACVQDDPRHGYETCLRFNTNTGTVHCLCKEFAHQAFICCRKNTSKRSNAV